MLADYTSTDEMAICSAHLLSELMVNRAPHPRPLSPEYQGEGRESYSQVFPTV